MRRVGPGAGGVLLSACLGLGCAEGPTVRGIGGSGSPDATSTGGADPTDQDDDGAGTGGDRPRDSGGATTGGATSGPGSDHDETGGDPPAELVQLVVPSHMHAEGSYDVVGYDPLPDAALALSIVSETLEPMCIAQATYDTLNGQVDITSVDGETVTGVLCTHTGGPSYEAWEFTLNRC